MSQVRRSKEKIYFISGHRDIYPREFTIYYSELIEVAWNEGARFVLGDCEGVDKMAQEVLSELVDKSLQPQKDVMRVTIFHMGDKPVNNVGGFPTLGGFTTDIERDSAMTDISDEDIAYIGQSRWSSGTAQNILRRFEIPLIEKEESQDVFHNWKNWLRYVGGSVIFGITIMVFWNIFVVLTGLGNDFMIVNINYFTSMVLCLTIIFSNKGIMDTIDYFNKSTAVLSILIIFLLVSWILG